MNNSEPSRSQAAPPFDEGAFLRNHDLLQTILDSLTHPFYVIDVADRRVRLANRAARQTHSGDAATCHALSHGQATACDSQDHPCPMGIVTQTGKPTVVEHIHRDEHGEPRIVEVHAFPIFDEAGKVMRIIEYCVDVTEQKRMMREHEWDLAVNRALAELADALIDPSFDIEEVADTVLAQARQLTGSEHGYVSSIDPETGDLIGHTLTHMMGRQCGMRADRQSIVFHPRPDGTYPALFGHALNTRQGFYTDAPGEHPASIGVPEGHIALKNFLTVPAVVGDMVVGQIALANSDRGYSDRELDAIGRMAKLYALAVQRMRRQTALKSSEERYALAQKAANIGSWDWNIVTGKLLWSERIEPMFGFAKGQFAGTYEAFLQCVHPDDRDFVVGSVNACVKDNADYRIEHRIVWPDGAIRWVSETGDVIRDADGEAVRMLGVVQDITDRKQAEQEIRKLNEELEQRVLARTTELTQKNEQLREEFRQRRQLEKGILEISEREQRRIGRELHDSLGQQLTGIAIISKALEQKLQRQSLKEADSAREIAQLVNEAIDQTRQLSHGLHPVSLDEDGLMSALRALAATTQNVFGVRCTFRCSNPVPVKDASAAIHLYRIAQEAVTNAIRHGDTKQILLGLLADPHAASLVIENDGRDFPAELPKSKGMGLQVMSYRAEMIGGTLRVQPREGGGTRVTCTFNLESVADRKEE
ncbi:MAG: PAS domain-containing protein [Sedimentisphaerales bacterium]|nr:PAS domain-containing protein [Sedimentisphaerales bacterium]